jgi:hypothetical protein
MACPEAVEAEKKFNFLAADDFADELVSFGAVDDGLGAGVPGDFLE